MSKNIKDKNEVNEEKKETFFSKMKNDKKYNAKVQLIGYGVFVIILIVWVNISSMGNGGASIGNIINTDSNDITNNETTSEDEVVLLDKLGNNYSYDIIMEIDKKSINTDTNEEVIVKNSISYKGKAYDNKLEILKTVGEVGNLYYKVDGNYYSMVNNITSSIREEVIYDIIDSNYIELDGIMDLISKSSLDHVTDYSSGKKVSVYHYKVLSELSSYQDNGVVEINVEEENEILKINIDYSNLFKVIDKSIDGCKLEVVVTDINKIEDFEVVVTNNENASVADDNS